MKIIKYPLTVRVDNIGVIFMASNITTMSCTKHVNIWYKYVIENIEDEFVKIIFVKSADTGSVIDIKNLSAICHEKH